MIYTEFDVVSTFQEGIPSDLRNVHAVCLVDSQDLDEGARYARYKIEQSGWKISRVCCIPTKVSLDNFENRDLGTEAYNRACEQGIAIVFVGVSEEQGSKNANPVRLPFQSEIDLAEIHALRKKIRGMGGCLYYANSDCDEMIEAHSIQRSGVLSLIAEDGEVFVPSSSYSDLKRNKGRLVFRRSAIRVVSTFRGFCKRHDNAIFRPIDDKPLVPTSEQALLYAYRSLGREITAKRNALQNYEAQLENSRLTGATRKLISAMAQGSGHGLKNLMRQKQILDASHREGTFDDDIRYVVFCARTQPTIVFSGGIFPQTGFYREKIQNIMESDLDQIFFSFAPMEVGWAFLFTWHKSSDSSCEAFLGSLAYAHRASERIEDLLFGMILGGCENLAIAPQWMAARKPDEIRKLETAMSSGASAFTNHDMRDVIEGVRGISDWKFDSVIDSRNST
jgi:hypothetical protein